MPSPERQRSVSLPVAIAEEEVLHFLGYPEGRGPAVRVRSRIGPLLDAARRLARARGIYMRIAVKDAPRVGLKAIEAQGLVLGLVTAGGDIESRAAALLAEGDSTGALILEAAGSAAAEEAADRLGAMIADGASEPAGARISCRVSPGYGDWPLSAQEALFALLPHEEIEVELLPSMLMVPRKSISFAMWLGAASRPTAGLGGCDVCRLPSCRYRRRAPRS